ncbi:transposase [Spirillospora sp. NPDC048823]|uniref:transposase n=1 Tax=unclassified Spirillospora TaxID=2642701 RepID=UPI003721522D
MNPDRARVPIDRELYVPGSWFTDPERLAAGVSDATVFATKPELAWRMIERATDDPPMVFGWVTGDRPTVTTSPCAPAAGPGA